ncbi:MAG: acyl-CoA mutase large subunit family protein [Gloeobacteraceae cyanobacterium ES-bin-144]|nr:acyl-CoA mutase large subunit family protein [Verrucomicrobiales bacterium]
MTTPAQAEQLLTEFPEHSYDQWHKAAEALLKGAPFEKLLVSKTYEDITIQPIYRREDIANLEHRKHFPGSGSLVRGSHAEGFLKAGWEVSQELKAPSPAQLNGVIHEGLNGGQSELNIVVGCGQADCCQGGVAIHTADDVKTVLSGVAVDAVSTYWQCGPSSVPTAALVFAGIEQLGVSADRLRGGFENDPLAQLVSHGSLRQSLKTRFDHMAALTDYAANNAPLLHTIAVKGDVYHNAGATATQELGYVIATLVCYIEEMKARGLSPETVLPHVRIRLSVGSDYFMEIAKIRATRWLWSKISAAYAVENAPVHIHACTSQWNKTTYDAHTNMLRVTAEAFAAVVGGVDSLHIGPYDEISGKTDEFSRRIARNVHTILREECGLAEVIDPAGGSTYIEWLTDQIAAKSWEIFQSIEKSGGMITALESGSVQQAVESVCKAKFQNIRRRKDKIVGSNMYPDLKGKKLEVLKPECKAGQPIAGAPAPQPLNITISANSSLVEQAIAAAKNGASKASLAIAIGLTNSEDAPTITPLPAHRAAEEYEALRDASAEFARKTGVPPAILQLNIGPSARYRLRADWTASFFEAAGFAVDGVRDFPNTEAAVNALGESTASIVVITSDDSTYQESVAPLATAIKTAKPNVTLLVAGAPGENESAWRSAGVDEFVNVRSNNYELNEQLLKKAGVL